MCNCGKKRTLVSAQSNALQNNYGRKTQPPVIQKRSTVLFQYTGNTALSVIGSVTRRNYRFSFPGDVQHIEFIDAAGMMAISLLKRIN